MKKLKPKQLGPWCDFCEPKTTRATHVGRCFNGFACEAHRDNLKKDELENFDEGYMSEADYQTWGRLR